MKAILISIQPKWTEKILNGEKTIEVRKKLPKDYRGWVYIYVTKDRKQCLIRNNLNGTYHLDTCYCDEYESNLNGKVVARFYCDNVGKINHWNGGLFGNKACLTDEELYKYLGDEDYIIDYRDEDEIIGYAIHISQLEIFDKPKELSEFKTAIEHKKPKDIGLNMWVSKTIKPLTKAPQNFCYVEV